jgi:hypothetical protein
MSAEDSGEYLLLAEDTNVARLRANVSFLWHKLDEIAEYAGASDEEFSRRVVLAIAYDRYERIDEENGILVVVPQRGGN